MARMPAIPAVQRAMVLACVFFVAHSNLVRGEDPIKWKTGSELDKALREPINRNSVELPLAESLVAFSRHAAVAILLDRRVDPGRLVNISAQNTPLIDELKDLAKTLDLGLATVGSMVYIGPKTSAARIDALCELRRREAAGTGRKAWLTTADSGWDDLAQPRELAAAIVQRAGAKIVNPKAIPHDVWAAWSGPPLSNIDRLTLVLAGFDLTFQLREDGAEVEIVPVPEELVFDRTYDVIGTPATVAGNLKRRLPDVKQIQPVGASRLRVTASAEQHAQVADLLAGRPTTTKTVVTPGEKVYTFKAENQLIGAMVQTLAKEHGLTVKADAAIVEKLKQRGSVEVEKATIESALRKVLDPVGIKFKITGKVLELTE